MVSTKRIGLVDDNEMFRLALASLIKMHVPNFEIITQASNGREFIELLEKMETQDLPDIVIVDVNMPEMNGFETARWLYKNFPTIKTMAISMQNNESSIIRMISLGVVAYLQKSMEPPEFISAIDAVIKNGFYYTGPPPNRMPPIHLKRLPDKSDVKIIWDSLSPEEQAFIKINCTDSVDIDIAKELKVTLVKLEYYKKEIFSKFKVSTRIGLALLALKNDLVSIQQF